jgi:hypothetical protein
MQQPMYAGPRPVPYDNNPTISIIALVLAILNLCLVVVPLCSLPVTVAALALGIVGVFYSHRGMGIAATALAGLALLAGVALFILGVALNLANTLPAAS